MPKVEINLRKFENTCFIIMPFSPVFEAEYRDIIRPAVEDADLKCVRADEIYSKPHVISDIWKTLRSARVVVAELSGKNTNVFYEVGIAHALGKPVIIITRNQEDVPFDLKALRYLFYDITDPFWGQNLRESLTELIRNILDEKEYGTVFEDIKVIGKTKFVRTYKAVIREVPSERQEYNLNGSWKGKMVFGAEEDDLDLQLEQKNNELFGHMIVQVPVRMGSKKEITIVEETIRGGLLPGGNIILNGVSYTFLRQGMRKSYSLDRFFGKVSTKRNRLSGKVVDHLGNEGTFSLERERK